MEMQLVQGGRVSDAVLTGNSGTEQLESLERARERRLIARLLKGEERAFGEFVEVYFARLYRFAWSRLGDDQAVDEVVQSVLSIAARRLETFRGESSLYTWLIQIGRNEISRHLKRASIERERTVPFLSDDSIRRAVELVEASSEDGPEQASQRAEVRKLIGMALDRLPAGQATALEMKYIQGCSSQEISACIGISDQAAQSLLARARRGFRDIFSSLVVEGTLSTASIDPPSRQTGGPDHV